MDEWLSQRSAKPSTAVRIRQAPPQKQESNPNYLMVAFLLLWGLFWSFWSDRSDMSDVSDVSDSSDQARPHRTDLPPLFRVGGYSGQP